MVTTLEEGQIKFEEIQRDIATTGIQTAAGETLQAPTINSASLLGGETPINLPTQEPVTAPALPVPAPEDALDKAQQDYLASISAPTSVADEFTAATQDPAFVAKEKEVADLSAQLRGINADALVAQQTLESRASGKDVTTRFLGRQQQEITRQAAIQGLPVAASLAAAQGRLQTAQSHLDKLFEFKVADAKAENDFKNKVAEITFEFASKKDQDRIEASIRKENREFEAQKTLNANANAMAVSLLDSQPQLAAQIAGIDWSQPDAGEKFSNLLFQAEKDPTIALDLQLKRAQIAESIRRTSLLGEPTAADKKATAAEEKATRALPLN